MTQHAPAPDARSERVEIERQVALLALREKRRSPKDAERLAQAYLLRSSRRTVHATIVAQLPFLAWNSAGVFVAL